MRWKKLKKLAFDHPYFDYQNHLLSEDEAERILSSGFMSLSEFMEVVKAPHPQGYHSHDLSMPIFVSRSSRPIRQQRVRRLAIALVVLLCITAFMTLTEPGVAFAKEIRNFVVQIFDGSFIARNTAPAANLPTLDRALIPDEFATLDEAAYVIGRSVANASAEDSSITNISVHWQNDDTMDLHTVYTTISQQNYFLIQSFYANNTSWAAYASAKDEYIKEMPLDNGSIMYIGCYDDGTVFGVAFDEATMLTVISSELSIDELCNIVKNIAFFDPK